MENLKNRTFSKSFFENIHFSKQTLRFSLRVLRKQLSLPRREEAAKTLYSFLKEKLPLTSPILSFASFGDEIDVWPLNTYLASQGTLLLPKVQGPNLKIYRIKNVQTDLSFSRWGILEPREDRCSIYQGPAPFTILVPALGFDSFYHRLGYGRGYYDRLLAQYPDCPSWGLGFKEQLLSHPIPIHSKDIALDALHLF